MTLLHYTEDRYVVLFKVGRGVVVWHDGTEAHCPGFSWQQSDMTGPYQELCSEALHARLIEVGHHKPWGAAVSLSDTGIERLAQWREQRLAGLRVAS